MKLDRSQYPEYPLPTKVSVQVKEDYKLLGTDIKLDRNKIYNATPATNHPDFTKYGLLFVDGVLLRREEYDFFGDGRMIMQNELFKAGKTTYHETMYPLSEK